MLEQKAVQFAERYKETIKKLIAEMPKPEPNTVVKYYIVSLAKLIDLSTNTPIYRKLSNNRFVAVSYSDLKFMYKGICYLVEVTYDTKEDYKFITIIAQDIDIATQR